MTDDKELIDQIKSIRIKNNTPWLEIFRIALKHDREQTLTYAKQILENDIKISDLLRALCRE